LFQFQHRNVYCRLSDCYFAAFRTYLVFSTDKLLERPKQELSKLDCCTFADGYAKWQQGRCFDGQYIYILFAVFRGVYPYLYRWRQMRHGQLWGTNKKFNIKL